MRRHREAVSKRHANPRKGRSRALTLREERWERECACRPVEGGGWGRGVGGGGWGITAVPPHPFLHGFRGREGGLGGGPPTISFVFPLSFLWFSISSRERPGRRAKGSLRKTLGKIIATQVFFLLRMRGRRKLRNRCGSTGNENASTGPRRPLAAPFAVEQPGEPPPPSSSTSWSPRASRRVLLAVVLASDCPHRQSPPTSSSP